MECLQLICQACREAFYWPAADPRTLCVKCGPAVVESSPRTNSVSSLYAQTILQARRWSSRANQTAQADQKNQADQADPDTIPPGTLAVLEPVVGQSRPDIYRPTLTDSDPTHRQQIRSIQDTPEILQALRNGPRGRQRDVSPSSTALRSNLDSQPDSQTLPIDESAQGSIHDNRRTGSYGTGERRTLPVTQYHTLAQHHYVAPPNLDMRGRRGRRGRGRRSTNYDNDHERDCDEEYER